jgi:hypothetical protein
MHGRAAATPGTTDGSPAAGGKPPERPAHLRTASVSPPGQSSAPPQAPHRASGPAVTDAETPAITPNSRLGSTGCPGPPEMAVSGAADPIPRRLGAARPQRALLAAEGAVVLGTSRWLWARDHPVDAAALAIRCLSEPVVVACYLWPALAVALVTASAPLVTPHPASLDTVTLAFASGAGGGVPGAGGRRRPQV